MRYFVLDEHDHGFMPRGPVEIQEWAPWFEAQRDDHDLACVARSRVPNSDIMISTRFMGCSMNYREVFDRADRLMELHVPDLWESVIMRGDEVVEERKSGFDRDAALNAHIEMMGIAAQMANSQVGFFTTSQPSGFTETTRGHMLRRAGVPVATWRQSDPGLPMGETGVKLDVPDMPGVQISVRSRRRAVDITS